MTSRWVRLPGLLVRWTALPQLARSLTDIQAPEDGPPEQAPRTSNDGRAGACGYVPHAQR